MNVSMRLAKAATHQPASAPAAGIRSQLAERLGLSNSAASNGEIFATLDMVLALQTAQRPQTDESEVLSGADADFYAAAFGVSPK